MTGGVGDGLWDGRASFSRIVWSGFNTLPVQAILFMKLILLFLLFYQAYGRESCQKRVGLIYIKKTNSNQHQLLASLCRGDQNLLNVNATCFGYLHQSLVHKRTKNPRRNKKTFWRMKYGPICLGYLHRLWRGEMNLMKNDTACFSYLHHFGRT